VTHLDLFKAYNKNGMFFLDTLATIPFYLITIYQFELERKDDPSLTCEQYLALNNDNSLFTAFKLIRMTRVRRILQLLDPGRISKIVETIFSNQTRSKRVVFQLIMKNFYKVFRLILLTVIITYFVGAIFYLISKLASDSGPVVADEEVGRGDESITVTGVVGDGEIPDAGADVGVGLVDGEGGGTQDGSSTG